MYIDDRVQEINTKNVIKLIRAGDGKEIRKYIISGKRSNIDYVRNIVKYVNLYQLQAQCT